ncbi:MAG: amidase [Pikeienuella sp.]
MSEIPFWSAIETADRIRAKDVSVVEVTEAHVARMQAANPAINAVTETVAEALDVARALDEAGIPDTPSPLHGVPVTVKSNVDQIGYPTSNGVPAFKDLVATENSPVVGNLQNGGAVIIARTNTPEFSLRWCTSNPLHGVTLNPWDNSVTPGGSSGGAAACVASGIGAIGHGNDLGGSLRYPAYCCGVASIRPSLGRVPAYNPGQAAERPAVTQSMSVQGPIARSIADVRAALRVMSAPDARDPNQSQAAHNGRKRGDEITVGFATNPFGTTIDPAVEDAMTRAIQGLRDAGITTREVTPPSIPELAQLWGDLLFTETHHTSRSVMEQLGSPEMQVLIQTYSDRSEQLGIEGYIDALTRRGRIQREWSLMFNDVDLLLMPTSLVKPFENDLDFKTPAKIPYILDAQAPLYVVNTLGLPAAALPTHLDNGVPVGVQLVGPMLDDWFVLDVAERLERGLGTIWSQLNAH